MNIQTKGRLIAIEGVDGVGKNTQSQLLRDYIVREKGECGFFSFPRYETETGKKVGAYLRGELGELSLIERARLYTNDRFAAREEMNSFLDRGVDVVCDRYVYSNAAYFTAIAKNEGMSNADVKEIEYKILSFEFNIKKLPAIDLLVILTLPVEISRELVLSKKPREYTTAKQDIHEKDINIQLLAAEYYNKYSSALLLCNDGDKVKTIEEIHNMVISKYTEDF